MTLIHGGGVDDDESMLGEFCLAWRATMRDI